MRLVNAGDLDLVSGGSEVPVAIKQINRVLGRSFRVASPREPEMKTTVKMWFVSKNGRVSKIAPNQEAAGEIRETLQIAQVITFAAPIASGVIGTSRAFEQFGGCRTE